MRVGDRWYRSIWRDADSRSVTCIDQTRLPFAFATRRLGTLDDAVTAIRDMQVRGAPLIGATAAYGLAIALNGDPGDDAMAHACGALLASRPTAVNLKWAIERVRATVAPLPAGERAARAFIEADRICDEDVGINESIGRHGLDLIRQRFATTGRTVNLLTHCNAGWLATVDWGTALAPIYKAHDAGIPVHVWVDETRPRNQGASLTVWELTNHGVANTLVVDNAGGYLMQHGMVDMCIVGSDRTVANGDVCNKIGTYLKALAAHDNGVPFLVAVPHSTIDLNTSAGADIPIEERAGEEVTHITGSGPDQRPAQVRITLPDAAARNPAFDVTPARLVNYYITETGVVDCIDSLPERMR